MGYDPYMGSGYRGQSARDAAERAVKSRSRELLGVPDNAEPAWYGDQVKPGITFDPTPNIPLFDAQPGMHPGVEQYKHPDYLREDQFPLDDVEWSFVPPGAGVPPVEVAAPAAGAGAAGLWAVAGSFAIGLGLGFWVKKDIDRFKRDAKLPFYDALKWQEADWVSTRWGVNEWLDDYWTKERADEAIEEWWAQAFRPGLPNGWNFIMAGQSLDVNWCDAPISEGGQGFTQLCSTAGPYMFHAGYAIAGHPSSHPRQCEAQSCGAGTGTANTDWVATPWEGFAQGLPGTFGNTCAIKQQRTDNALWIAKGGMSVVPGTSAANITNPDNWAQEFVQVGTVVQTDVGYGTPLKWADAVAPEGSQPSEAQQSVPGRLSRGRPGNRAGYTVPFHLGYPFTAIRVAPGTSSPVTVPDQVIDPGSETDPGGVTIVPPGHPPGNPPAQEDKKPWTRVFIKGGMLAINAVTETQDFLEALHEGLPKHLRSKGRNGGDVPPWVILEDLWDHYDQWDAQVGIEAYINNQIEDAIYGRFFGLQSRIQRRAGVTAGLGRGVKGYRPTKLVVPEVHFADGAIEVTFGEWSIGG